MIQPIFDDKSISSIAGRGSRNTPALLMKIRETIAANEEGINAFIKAIDCSTKNISSLLNKAGIYTREAIEALTNPESIEAFKTLIKSKRNPDGLFAAKNISSMLSGSGKHLKVAIEGLTDPESVAALKLLIKSDENPDGLFAADNVSSMLASSGKDLVGAIKAIMSRIDKFKRLLEIVSPSQISNKLNAASKKHFGATIDTLYDTLLSEMNGSTMIAAQSGVEIANGSQASLKTGLIRVGKMIKIFAEKITREKSLVYDMRAILNGEKRFFIIKVSPHKHAAFLKAVKQDAGFCLEEYGDILHRGWGEPEETLKEILREQYGMYLPIFL